MREFENKQAECKIASVSNHQDFVKTIFNPIKITLNIRERKYDIRWKALEKLPDSRLGKIRYSKNLNELKSLCDDVSIEKNEIYFNKSFKIFESILESYFCRNVHYNSSTCVIAYKNDFNYWGIQEHNLESCCVLKYIDEKDEEMAVLKNVQMYCRNKEFIINKILPITIEKVWIIMEHPQSSILSRFIAKLSSFFVLFSTISFLVSTLPEYKSRNEANSKDHLIFDMIETVCTIWFTIEFLLRAISTPDKKTFVYSLLNFIDFLAIVPFFSTLILAALITHEVSENLGIFAIFKIIRILRILKLMRHSEGIQMFTETMKQSLDLLKISILLASTILFFGSIIYYIEEDDVHFTSIPVSLWFSFVTVTSVGYGDILPITMLGKILSSLCSVIGLVVISLTIPMITTKFENVYELHRAQNKLSNYMKIKNDTIITRL